MPAAKTQEQTQEGPGVTIPVAGVHVALPPRQNIVYYAGLGAMAAFELIDWPVALAVAAGYALATHDHHQQGQ
jgi:hypothetical protein